jgi:hypothetical protein
MSIVIIEIEMQRVEVCSRAPGKKKMRLIVEFFLLASRLKLYKYGSL